MNRELPEWYDGKKINEVAFCKDFLKEKQLICVNGIFYGLDGAIAEDALSAQIYDKLKEHVTSNLSAKVESIIKTLKMECRRESLPTSDKEIHLSNGVLGLDRSWTPEKKLCANRLNVEYHPEIWNDVYYPTQFLTFLYEMLDGDDVTTLQEYLGYCLIPSTKAQAALFIIGNGGEGKSCIGVVLQEIFKSALISGSFQRIETDKFFRYNLQNKLIMLDDDMQLEALSSTGMIKTLITANIPVDVEAKGRQSEQARLYSRFICFGNGSPKTLYDKSDGFARRLLILTTNPIPKDRISNPNITDIFIAEKEKIFCWMFEGLLRLIDNKYKFTMSEKTRQNITDVMTDGCNAAEFLNDTSYITLGGDSVESSQALYSAYSDWCRNNLMTEMSKRTFSTWLGKNADKYGLVSTNHAVCGNRTGVRGYKGIKSHFSTIIS